MKTHKTYQLRGYLTRAGYQQLNQVLRECATLYNAALQERRDAWRMAGKSISCIDQFKELTLVRRDLPEWAALHLRIGRGVLRRADRAFQAFSRRVEAGEKPGYPRFKSGSRWRTIELEDARRGMVRDGKVKVKGLPVIRIPSKLPLPSSTQLERLGITRAGRRVTVNLTYAVETCPLPPSSESVGLDMGVTDRVTLSTGESIPRRDFDREAVKRAQRRLSRCQKGSREFRKRALILANLHGRNRVRNRNQCHQVTTELVRRFGHIAVEDLQIRNMTASAAGTVEEPGTNVAAKSGLNREILAQTWGVIHQQLTYKAAWAGRELVKVDPRNTSRTCSACGVVDAASRSGKRFRCTGCGFEVDADVNAAVNILKKSLAGGSFPPTVREP